MAEFGLIFTDNLHTRATVDRWAHEGLKPAMTIEYVHKNFTPRPGPVWKEAIRKTLFNLGLLGEVGVFIDNLRCEDRSKVTTRYRFNIQKDSSRKMVKRAKFKYTQVAAEKYNAPEVCQAIKESGIQYWFVKGLGIVRQPLLDTGAILLNTHKGWLPNTKGVSATIWSILQGDPYGITVHQIDLGLDTGPILHQIEEPLPQAERVSDLVFEEAYMAGKVDFQAAKMITEGRVSFKKNEGGSYYHAIHPVLCEIANRKRVKGSP